MLSLQRATLSKGYEYPRLKLTVSICKPLPQLSSQMWVLEVCPERAEILQRGEQEARKLLSSVLTFPLGVTAAKGVLKANFMLVNE